jgi:beta-glucosidase
MARINDAVRRILRIKFRAGLFDHPYVDQAKAADPASFVTPADRAAERSAADESMVLLKNDGNALPLDPTRSVAIIGPLGDDQHDMLGPWWGQGRDSDAVSLLTGMQAQDPNVTFTQACAMNDIDPPALTPADECGSDAGFAAAVAAASSADQIVLALGETRGQSGESASRSEIDLPGKQQELVDMVAATGKPFVVVLFSGRPLTLSAVDAEAPAILEAWFPGIEAGNAVADVLFGKVNPSGKLPVSFPRTLGQIPIYYDHLPTGRPCDITQKYDSRYRDLNSCDPLYAFGYGLSYTTFAVTNLRLSSSTVSRNGSVTASVDVQNTGARSGADVVQLYIHDPVASIEQPVRRLRGFQRVTLAPGEKQTISFTLDQSDFGFYDNGGRFLVEPGEIDVYAGDSSAAALEQSFTVGSH